MENTKSPNPFSAACLQARLQVPLEPLAESVPMPETPQIGDEIRSTFGEFKGVENKENPGSDMTFTRYFGWFMDPGMMCVD